MSFDSTSLIGLPTHILSQVEQKLQKPVSRELHAFCHLSPPDSPAAVELLRLSQDELSQFSGTCKEAINQWCCCARDYAAQPDGPSLTTRNSTLIARVLLSLIFSPRSNKRLLIYLQTKGRDGCCTITARNVGDCHGAHIFPYSLGKTQQKATLDIWKVLEMFWGLERKDQLQQLIFGQRDTTFSLSKTQINALHNMITLSPEVHTGWARGRFTLEPLEEEDNPYSLRAMFRWTPQKSESPKELGIATDPTSIELVPPTDDTPFFHVKTYLPITDGHIVTFTTNDPINAPIPHRDLLMLQCFLIRVLRMAGRAGEDMLETFDTDDEVSLRAASNAGSTDEQTAHDLTQSPLHLDGTNDLQKPPLAPSPDLGIDMATPLEQPQKRRQGLFLSISNRLSCLQSFRAYLHRKNGQNRTASLSNEKVNSNIDTQAQNGMSKSSANPNELTLQVRQKAVMASS